MTGIPAKTSHRVLRIGIAGFLAVAGEAKAQDTTKPGIWFNPEQGWVVESGMCGAELCSHLIAFRMKHPHPPGYIPRDEKNSDPALRNRPLCGLQLMGGFDPAKRHGNILDGGWVYDPQTGKVYEATLTLAGPDTVKLRGFIGIPLFGKTVILKREADAGTRCTVPPAG